VNHFCTISTHSHLYKVSALAESLANQGKEVMLHVLVVDNQNDVDLKYCKQWKLSDITRGEGVHSIIGKYKSNKDKLRWSLKPVFLKHLINEGVEKIIYLDNDLFFYSDYQFLFDYLQNYSFLLTPHYYKIDPQRDQNWFEANFRVGLFNAGFIGVNKNAIKTLQWWADCCLYRCEKNSFRGLFDDQKYLDLVPVIEEGSYIIRHKGCNVAGWNSELCKREIIDYKVTIDGKFPIVFIHFNDTTVREITNGEDEILYSFYNDYVHTLKKYKANLSEKELLFKRPWTDSMKFSLWKVVTEFGI
jgi:hypothetical protein